MNSPRLHGPVLTDEPVTVVTVGVRGIGAGIAAALCRTGYRTVAFDRLEQTTATARLEHVVVDMAPSSAVEKAVGTVLEESDRLDVLVINAGIVDTHALDDTPEEVWDRVIAINLKSVFQVSRAALPALRAHGGAIVNISSVHAATTVPALSPTPPAKSRSPL